MEDKGNVIKLVPFDTRKKKVPFCWGKFKAACTMKDCVKALEKNVESGLPATDA